MSAPKRARQQKAEWLLPTPISAVPERFSKAVLDYPGAKLALERITGASLNRELIFHTLYELARRKDESKLKASHWYAIRGKPLHTLRRFPDKVHGWARKFDDMLREFQKSRAYGYVASSLPLYLQHGQRTDRKKGRVPDTVARNILDKRADFSKMLEIPEMLHLYADYFEAVCTVTADLAPEAPSQYTAALKKGMIDSVTFATGKQHYEEIATLINAAYAAEESTETVNATETVDANSLKNQRSRAIRRRK